MSYREIKASRGEIILVDEADFDQLSKYSWCTNATGYAYAYARGTGRKNRQTVTMHRLVMDFPKGMRIDHINRNKLDNRRDNLRICTNSQNLGNSIGYSKKTKFKGLDLLPNGKWRARINIGGKSIHLGVAFTDRDAAKLYDEAAIKHYGEFAFTNFGGN